MPELLIENRSAHYVGLGKGAPLLLVHGFPLDHRMWSEVLEPLSRTAHVLAVDLPGFGNSEACHHPRDASPAPLSMAYLADWCAHFLDAKGLDQVAFCGLSMGGYIGWEFARRHPNRWTHLIACNTRAAADSELIRRGRAVAAASALNQGTAQLAMNMIPKLFGRSVNPDCPLQRSVEQMIQSVDPTVVAAAQLGMAERADMTEWLPTIERPVLFVAGENDTITSPEEMQQNSRLVPNSQFAEAHDAGHLVPLQQPERFCRFVESFLDETRPKMA